MTQLRHYRERLGMTLKSVARAVPCSSGWLSRIEARQQTPSLAVIARLSKILGLSDGEIADIVRSFHPDHTPEEAIDDEPEDDGEAEAVYMAAA